ncbi:MAG: glucoamylase family protein [Methylotetracoccus sp.]
MAYRPIRALLLALVSHAVCGAESVPDGRQVLANRTLADFEQPAGHPLALAWRRNPATTEQALRYETVSTDRGGGGQALHLAYRLPEPPATNVATALNLDLLGLDASGFDHLSIWIKGDGTAGFSPTLMVGFERTTSGDPPGRHHVQADLGEITADWRQIIVPLASMPGFEDRSGLSSLEIAVPATTTVRHGGYFIDDVSLVKLGGAPLSEPGATGPAAAESSAESGLNARAQLRGRLNGWPSRGLVDVGTLPADDDGFLRRLAADTWRGLDALADREHGLPIDRVQVDLSKPQPEPADIGDYTNITSVGFYLLAVVAAQDLKLLDEAQALERIRRTVDTLERLETAHGFFFNYYNTTTLQPTSRFLSFVDSSWLTAGLIVARQAAPALAERLSRLISRGNFRFFYDPGTHLMSHGHFVDTDKRSSYHYGMLYTEARIGSLIAIGKGDVEAAHWFAMTRTLPPEVSWQTRPPQNRHEKSERGFQWTGGHYEWNDIRYVPSWGGSLFEALMPRLVLDEARLAPESLGRNGAAHTALQRRYASEALGYPVWGMSPSSTPGSAAYGEYGVRILGALGYPEGVVTPHAAALALLAEPDAAIRNLRTLAQRYPIYGDFGFYDSVDPKTGQVASIYLCLDQAMILVALADHLAGHSIQNRFAADPLLKPALDLIGFEHFFD